MIAFIFPGQGSQKRGMGMSLFDEVPEYRAAEQDVNDIVGYSMRKLCIEDPDGRLKETQFTQPSLFIVNALYWYKAIRSGQGASFLAGHSLGEYNALFAAGVFDLLTGLRLVKKRGELMAQAPSGGMAAVIGIGTARIAEILKDNKLSNIDIANFNSPSQIVISGPASEIRNAGPVFEKAGARLYMPLQVSAAFHSRYVAEAASLFADFLAPMSFNAPKVPVIANATAQPYPVESPSDSTKSLLIRQITQSVLWDQSVRFLIAHGVNEFKELGVGNVLTRLVDQVRQDQSTLLTRLAT
jgi:malonyl CoA-acyl carrier protein transacylase